MLSVNGKIGFSVGSTPAERNNAGETEATFNLREFVLFWVTIVITNITLMMFDEPACRGKGHF